MGNNVRATKCYFCKAGRNPSYKNPEELRKFVDETGRIKPVRMTKLCGKHQKKMSSAVKCARHIALM